MESKEQQPDLTLQEANDALAAIVSAYAARNRKGGRKRAMRYATANMEYARTHLGQIEMSDGSDASPHEMERWRKALGEAKIGNWEAMKKEIGDDAIGFGNTEDEEWRQIHRALTNLAALL